MLQIDMNSFLMNRIKYEDLSPELQHNANDMLLKANALLQAFGEYRKCNSGYRSPEDQARINPKAMHSKHLTCQAVDLDDADGKLNKFCKDNLDLMQTIGIWLEERQGGWQHIQRVPPASGHRFFNP